MLHNFSPSVRKNSNPGEARTGDFLRVKQTWWPPHRRTRAIAWAPGNLHLRPNCLILICIVMFCTKPHVQGCRHYTRKYMGRTDAECLALLQPCEALCVCTSVIKMLIATSCFLFCITKTIQWSGWSLESRQLEFDSFVHDPRQKQSTPKIGTRFKRFWWGKERTLRSSVWKALELLEGQQTSMRQCMSTKKEEQL